MNNPYERGVEHDDATQSTQEVDLNIDRMLNRRSQLSTGLWDSQTPQQH